MEEAEITSLVGLRHLAFEELTVSPGEAARWGRPAGASAFQFFFGDMEMEFPVGDIQFDLVTVFDQGEWAPDRRLR